MLMVIKPISETMQKVQKTLIYFSTGRERVLSELALEKGRRYIYIMYTSVKQRKKKVPYQIHQATPIRV